nr:hypothetical protein [Tanacetum cinerariifolium]
ARIAQSSALSPVADEPASPMRDVSEGEACPTDSCFIADQDRATIAKARSADDALIKRMRIDEEEGITGRVSTDTEEIRTDEWEVAVERTSGDTEEMAIVLTSMDATTVLAGGIDVPTGSYFISTIGPPTVDIHTGSDVVPTASLIVATAIVVTPYSRRKGKEVMVESDTPKKQRLQEEIDAQVARELEEQLEREDKRMTEQITRDAEVARIHAEEELQGMTFEEIEAKFAAVWKSIEDFIPMGSKEEFERLKRKGFNLEQEKAKKQKTSEEVPDKEKSPEEIPEEKVKEMMQLVPIEEVEDLNQLWVLVKEYLNIRPASTDKEMELWVELKRLYELDPEDQLWAQTQNYIHAPIEWKLYDLSRVHHVTAKDKEIFMLVEQDYPLRKGLALVMICYKLQVENYSQMTEDLIQKIYNIANSPRQQGS